MYFIGGLIAGILIALAIIHRETLIPIARQLVVDAKDAIAKLRAGK